MMDNNDIEFLKKLVKEKAQYYKNRKAGIKHFLEYKIRIGEPEQLIRTDKKEIEELNNRIEYTSTLLTKLDELKNL